MGISFKSLSYTTNPSNPQINNDTFISAPIYTITISYYSNCADDDLAVAVKNDYQAVGSDVQQDRNDLAISMNQGSGVFESDEIVGLMSTTYLPSIYLSTSAGNFWRNQIVKVESTPVPYPPPSTPNFQYIGKLASAGPVAVLFNDFTSSLTNPIPAGTRIYSPKILKTVVCSLFFNSAIIKSGIYTANVTFTHTFTNQIIKTQQIIIKYSDVDSDVGGGVPKSFIQHQWGYVAKNPDYTNTNRIVLSHDLPTVFAKADTVYKFKIYLSGFDNKGGTDTIDDSTTIEFKPKTNLNRLEEGTLAKKIIK